ncbi:hypothetical protein [Corynebacterium aquilae]|uniref:hypothetical protein n=1 Tax=Corynebacterium aquilae TaxID=203263 RepID=UPI000952D225|nr:hypothetical protein [Corynebacterium aquilae]
MPYTDPNFRRAQIAYENQLPPEYWDDTIHCPECGISQVYNPFCDNCQRCKECAEENPEKCDECGEKLNQEKDTKK